MVGSYIQDIIFLGTGTSGCIPNVPCLISKSHSCKVCLSSVTPEGRKNRRRNTSLLVRILQNGVMRNILIDCGKTYYESAVEWFPKYDVGTVDAVFLTHGHADSILGMDDLRQWTMYNRQGINVYLDQQTMDVVSTTFPYLVDRSKATGGGEVPNLNFIVFEENQKMDIFGVVFEPLKVEHGVLSSGEPYWFNGFKFDNISYISDCSKIPESTGALIKDSKILVIDALRWTPHLSHFGYYDALEAIKLYTPKKAYLTDFCHRIDHFDMEEDLKARKNELNIDIEPAYDGLLVNIENDR